LRWRRFVGLADAGPDETTLVHFRQRWREHGLHEQLLGLVNRQLQARGLILKTCILFGSTNQFHVENAGDIKTNNSNGILQWSPPLIILL